MTRLKHLFLHHLYIENYLQRETSNQFDRDQFTAICKADFREQAEFVAMHFALSQRDDTEYWRHWTNQPVAPELINQTFAPYTDGYSKAVFDVHRRNHFSYNGGIHCIGTGMHWSPTDRPSFAYNFIDVSSNNFKPFADRLT